MRRTVILVLLAVVAPLIVPASVSSAFTETIVVQDDVIFIDNDSDEPNAPPVEVGISCPQILPEMGPGLVFVETQALEEHLYVTCFQGGLRREELASAKYLQVTQLDHGIFLVGTSGGSTDRGVFVIDLDRGVGKQIARSTRIHCLRSVPDRGKAMLIHSHLGIGEVRYLELDLVTLGLTLSHTFKQTDLGDQFVGVCPGAALSPDFTQVAYMAADSWPASRCRLTLMELATREQSVLDDHVGIVFSPISSDLGGTPPLDWIAAEEIIYRHMPVADMNDPNLLLKLEALCVFKRADIGTGAVSEVLQQTLRLGVGAGSLKLNPLNGELIYNGQSVLDPDEGTFTPAIAPFSIVNEYHPSRGQVFLGEELLHAADGTIESPLISPLHQHLAYVVSVTDAEPGRSLYTKVADIAEPILVANGVYPTVPAGWVE
jgi:hypothetical protein